MTEKKEMKVKKTEKKEVKEKQEMNEVLMFTPVIETVGTRLKKCREEKKIKLSQISKALCIRESFLTALEEGEYEVFPALVYAGGFMRSYAVYLGLDEKEVMQQFHKETEYMVEKSAEVPVVTSKNIIPSKKLLISLLILICVGYGVLQVLKHKEDQEPAIQHQPVVLQVNQDLALTDELLKEGEKKGEGFVLENGQQTPQESSIVSETQPKENEKTPTETLSKELQEAVPQPSDALENPFMGKVFGVQEGSRVSILATNSVWVEMKSEDQVVFTRVLKKGESYAAPATGEPVVLKTGNAGAVLVYVDGQFKKVLGREGHVLKGIKLIPETFVD